MDEKKRKREDGRTEEGGKRGQIGLVKLSRDSVLSYQTRNEGLKATTDNWWRLKVPLKCLVLVEKEGGEV